MIRDTNSGGAESGVWVGKADGILERVGSTEGDALGVMDGVSDGATVGDSEGIPVGICDGVPDGASVGDVDGYPVGTCDGSTDGSPVGVAEGTPVGARDGVTDGTSDLDGVPVGTSVGDFEGVRDTVAEADGDSEQKNEGAALDDPLLPLLPLSPFPLVEAMYLNVRSCGPSWFPKRYPVYWKLPLDEAPVLPLPLPLVGDGVGGTGKHPTTLLPFPLLLLPTSSPFPLPKRPPNDHSSS